VACGPLKHTWTELILGCKQWHC